MANRGSNVGFVRFGFRKPVRLGALAALLTAGLLPVLGQGTAWATTTEPAFAKTPFRSSTTSAVLAFSTFALLTSARVTIRVPTLLLSFCPRVQTRTAEVAFRISVSFPVYAGEF